MLTIAFAAAPVNAQQAPRGGPILFDAAGRQLETPHEATGKAPATPGTLRNSTTSSSTKEPGFGRVPLEGGTFGLETSKKLQPDRFPDGRPVPGIESRRLQNNSPFVGFSLSVPTN